MKLIFIKLINTILLCLLICTNGYAQSTEVASPLSISAYQNSNVMNMDSELKKMSPKARKDLVDNLKGVSVRDKKKLKDKIDKIVKQ